MALDFPTSPTNGQVYGNYYYDSSKGAWRANQTPIAETTVSPTAPVGASAGDLWYNTSDGNTYVRYNDGSSTQWVQMSSLNGFSSTIGPTVDALNVSGNTNYILNSDFSIWQRGTSFTNLASETYGADRWTCNGDGSGATKVWSQQAFTPGAAPVAGYESAYFLRYAQSVAGTGATYNNPFKQKIEDVRTLAGQTVTVSFWAKADATRTITPNFQQAFGTGGSASVFAVGSAITLSTSWARYTQTYSLPSISGKTIGTSSFLELYFTVANNTVQTIDIWGVQVQSGSLATQYHRAHPSIQAELAACQRYYLRLTPGVQYGEFGSGLCVGNPYIAIAVHFPVAMRIPPTSFEYSSLSHFRINHSNTALTPLASLYTDSMGVNSSRVIATHASATAGTACLLETAAGNTTGYIAFNAEL